MAKRIRSAVLLTVIAAMLLGLAISPASAHWGTSRHIHVIFTSDNWNGVGNWYPHINPANVTIWKPDGSYWSRRYNGWSDRWSKGATIDIGPGFDNAKTGVYKVVVTWDPWFDSKTKLTFSQSRKLESWQRNMTFTFQSP